MITDRRTDWPQTVPPIRVVDTRDTLRRVERHALLAARDYANVLISGERGAGKAGLARFIHENSDRATRGFATINCERLPDRLIESELFGHVQGSFTGAYRDKPGLFESVPGGTIFLDQVEALSLRTQGRLLRFLETGDYVRMGGRAVRIQPWLAVRIIAATSADLAARAHAGWFLNDLYVRLCVHHLPVPAPPAGTPAWRHQ